MASALCRLRHARRSRDQRYFLLAFHDEMVEALAHGIDARLVRATLRALMTASVDDIIGRPHRP
ncbi:MAG: hypothetical protein ACRD2C_00105 [Acidimicrobiales bacterium]